MSEPKRIDIAEFRKLGFLQEANRLFFHPLGLALEAIVDDDGTERLGGVWDYREDPEGIIYSFPDTEENRRSFSENVERVQEARVQHVEARIALLGQTVQPVEKCFVTAEAAEEQ